MKTKTKTVLRRKLTRHSKRAVKRILTGAHRAVRLVLHAAGKASRHSRRAGHVLTHKKVLRRKHSRRLGRSVFVIIALACTSSLAFGIATTKPTVNIQIRPGKSTHVINVAPPIVTANAADQIGTASWYAFGLPAPDALTCASTTFSRGTYLKVTNRRNGKSVTCLVNDYGPEPWTNRAIDLSRGSFRVIEDLGSGTTPVEIRVVPPPPTSFNLPLSASKFGEFIGYRWCRNSHTAQFCEQNRQQP